MFCLSGIKNVFNKLARAFRDTGNAFLITVYAFATIAPFHSSISPVFDSPQNFKLALVFILCLST
jgi:hypothetical protein